MDKNQMMQALAREASERGSFNGTWLYAEHGEIVSKGALGWRDAENTRPMEEDMRPALAQGYFYPLSHQGSPRCCV